MAANIGAISHIYQDALPAILDAKCLLQNHKFHVLSEKNKRRTKLNINFD